MLDLHTEAWCINLSCVRTGASAEVRMCAGERRPSVHVRRRPAPKCACARGNGAEVSMRAGGRRPSVHARRGPGPKCTQKP